MSRVVARLSKQIRKFAAVMLNFIDTHSHLYDAAYEGDGSAAVRRAFDAGVTKIVMPDTDSSVREAMFALCDGFPGRTFPCLGLHPTEFGDDWRQEIDSLRGFVGRNIVAVGETGMDLHWRSDNLEDQAEVFRIQLELSLELGLPVIIHNREATAQVFRVLEDFRGRGLRGVFHAYGGSVETFREMDRYGDWYVGIGGVLTFKKASIAETVKSIPLDRILLETDSPYLTPAPYRGTRNESSYIPIIAGKLAELKEVPVDEVASVTTANAEKLFGI